MKREVHMTLQLYACILRDARIRCALDAITEVEIDSQCRHLKKLLETRGMRIVMIDFPSVAKLFDKALSGGFFPFSDARRILGNLPKSPYPKLFWYLFQEVLDEEGFLRTNADPEIIFFIRQVLLMMKKYDLDCSDAVKQASIIEFRDLDLSVRVGEFQVWNDPANTDLPLSYHKSKGSDTLFSFGSSFSDHALRVAEKIGMRVSSIELLPPKQQLLVENLVSVFRYVGSSFPLLNPSALVPQHGTGAVSDMPWGDKYSFPTWSSKLETVFKYDQFAILNFMSRHGHDCTDSDEPVKILAVPKTLKGPRIIGAETVSRMFCQQALRNWVKTYIPRATCGSVEITDQTRSQRFARIGSVDGSYATIDLSSASDRLSCCLVEELFASNMPLLAALAACRATYYSILTGDEQEIHPMRKFSHQGSAMTFPIQSLAYYSIAAAVCLTENGQRFSLHRLKKVSRHITVYGDDIIVPANGYERTIETLELWGLKVNVDKSHGAAHHDGACFRESCGVDAFSGIDVTPIYARGLTFDMRKPESVVRFVEVGNNFHKAGLWQTSCRLFSLDGIDVPITPSERVPLGCFTYSPGCQAGHLRSRWNSDHQVREYRTLVPSVKGQKKPRDGYQSILQFIIEGPEPTEKWVSGYYDERPKISIRKKWTTLA